MAQAIAKNQLEIEQYGPYGSQLPENYSFQLAKGEHVKEVLIGHGFIVDAIGFKVAKPDGTTYTVQFGGNFITSKVVLEDGEYVTRISGTYGNYKYQQDKGVVVGTIKIHTNLHPDGFGPYGKGQEETNVQEFTSPKLTNGPVVGVFGRHDKYIESIGVFIKPDFQN